MFQSIQIPAFLMFLSISYAISSECPNVIQFAYNLGIQTASPAIWALLESDCCDTIGITCINENVTEIQWYTMGLTGFINGTAIPPEVTLLSLHDNSLTGSIPSNLPNRVVTLWLSGNQLTGNIPSSMPSGLVTLGLGYNQLNGSIPSSLPCTLT